MRLKQFILNHRRIFSGVGVVSLLPLASSSLLTAFLIQNQDYFQSLSLSQLQASNLTQLLQNPDQNSFATALLIITALISVGGLLILF